MDQRASISRTLVAAAAILVAATAAQAGGRLVLNPQVGFNIAKLTTDADEIKTSAKAGFELGGNLRLGLNSENSVYLSPGILFHRTSTSAETDPDFEDFDIEDDLDLTAFQVPVLLGFKLSQNASASVRLFAGAGVSIVTDVEENEFTIDKDNVEDIIWSGIAGGGVDLGIISIDLQYDFGLTDVIDEAGIDEEDLGDSFKTTKANTFRVLAGLTF